MMKNTLTLVGKTELPNASVELYLTECEAVLKFRGLILNESVDELQRLVELACSYYQYEDVRLMLDSPGGSAPAVLRWLGWLRPESHQLQQKSSLRPKRLHTQALTQAYSAAAMMLTAGDWGCRRVRPDSELVYHLVRIRTTGATHLTQADTRQLSLQMRSLDMVLPKTLLDSAIRFLGEGGLRSALHARAQWLQCNWTSVPDRLKSAGAAHIAIPKRPPIWLRVPMNTESSTEVWLIDLERQLLKELTDDSAMSPLHAWCWGLIDEVIGVLNPLDGKTINGRT